MKESNKQWSLPEIIGGIILVIIFLWLIRSPHPPVLPEAPSDLIARVISSSSIEFSWTDNSDNETGFQVYRKRGEDFVLMATTSANNGFYTDIGFFFPATYYYRIRAVNKEGDSDWSNTASVTISEGEPKDVTFEWRYRSSPYTLTETLYKSAYDYYKSQLKVVTCSETLTPAGKMICESSKSRNQVLTRLEVLKEDNTISQIVSDIKSIGEKANLDEDQIVDLAIAFVQSIPYDEVKAEKIKSSENADNDPELLPRYAYETLYDNKGICSDKAILAALLIQKLEYGTALFFYDNYLFGGHIALGIKCLKEYSSYDSGYCYTELTNPGWKIGIIPDKDNSGTIMATELGIIEIPSFSSITVSKKPNIYEVKKDGKTYNKVVENIEEEKKIISLVREIKDLYDLLKSYELKLKYLLPYKNLFEPNEEYNHYVDLYNGTLKDYQQKINELKKILDFE